MTVLTVSEARAEMHKLLDAVERGDEVTLTRHGNAVAVVIRPDLLRVRRSSAAMGVASDIGARLESGRTQSMKKQGLSKSRADEMVAELRADRSGR